MAIAGLVASASTEPRVAVATLLVTAAVGLVTWMSAMQRTVASDEGIAIHRFARVQRIAWNDLARF